MNQTECAEMCANIARYFEDRMAKAAEAGDLTKTRDFSLRALTAWDCARSIQIGQMDDSADVFAASEQDDSADVFAASEQAMTENFWDVFKRWVTRICKRSTGRT